jgi:hypothetical protein
MRPLYHSNKKQFALTVENPMYKSLLLSFVLVVAVLALGCAKSESTTNKNATAPATSAPATTPATTTAGSSDSIGVAECDAYIAAYEKCVKEKVPEAARAQTNAALAQSRKSWKELAANPQTKATLAGACKTAMDAARQSMKAYGCTF